MLPGAIGFQEIIIIGIIAVVLFGKRLPEVARTAGKYYHDFKKSLNDMTSSFDPNQIYDSESSSSSNNDSSRGGYEYDDYEEATAPKFEPPKADSDSDS